MTESKNNKKEEIKIESHPSNTNIESKGTNSQKQCKSCFERINISATVCQHCGQHQSWWGRHFSDITVTGSIVMIIIAAVQLIAAFKEQIDASEALRTAKSAAENSQKVLTQIMSDANEIARLKRVVENQSATIDLVAEQATKAKELSQEVANKNTKAEQKLTEIDSALSKAKENLANLESYSQYYAVVIAALGEHRIAYDQLGKWASDNSFPFGVLAQQIYQKIMDDHSGPYQHSLPFHWKENIDPNKLTFEQLKQEFFSVNLNQNTYQRLALLEYIWQRNDIPKILRLDFMVDVMRTEKHLMVCEYAGHYFTQEVKLKMKPLGLDIIIKWWEDNRSKFKEKSDPKEQDHQNN